MEIVSYKRPRNDHTKGKRPLKLASKTSNLDLVMQTQMTGEDSRQVEVPVVPGHHSQLRNGAGNESERDARPKVFVRTIEIQTTE
eukprot:3258698-Amphidinium_carterae.1